MRLVIKMSILYCIITSCASKKIDNRLLNNYIKTEFAAKYDTLFVSAEQIPATHAISVYQRGYQFKDKTDEKPVYSTLSSPIWPLDDKDMNQLNKQFENKQNGYWKNKDFTFNAVIIPKDYFKFKVIAPNNNRVLNLSRVIYNSEKNVALFEYSLSTTGFAAGTSEYGVVVMTNQNGKWVKEILLWEEMYF